MDRLMRMGLAMLVAIPNRLQNWIGSASLAERGRRGKRAFAYNVWLGLAAGTSYVVLIAPAVHILFTGEIEVGRPESVVFGCVVAVICASRGAGLWLVSIDRANAITLAIVAAALIGIPSIYLLARGYGTLGGAFGELMAEVIGLVMQLLLVSRATGSRGPGRHPTRA